MNSMKRIFTTTRAMVAELPLGHYLLSSIVMIILLIIHSSETNTAGINQPGFITRNSVIIPQFGAYIFITISALLAATILGVDFVSREFKHENRASRLLSLPLSPGERAMTLGTMSWVVFPLLCTIPPFLILAFISLFGGTTIMTPQPQYFLLAIPLAWGAIILTSSLWLFPALAIPKRGAVAFIMILCMIGVYVALSREGISDTTFIDYTNSPFQETDVVGMQHQNVLSNADIPTKYGYQLPDRFGFSGMLGVLSVLTLYVAAVIALTRKTA